MQYNDMHSLQFRIEGKPIALKRHRTAGRVFYDPQKEEKHQYVWMFRKDHPGFKPIAVPIRMIVIFSYKMPRSFSKKKMREMMGKPKDTHPDNSNLVKFLEDAYNNVIWKDDRLIYQTVMVKVWGENDSTTVILSWDED